MFEDLKYIVVDEAVRNVICFLQKQRNEWNFAIKDLFNPEFRSSAVQTWCIDHNVKQVFSRPGKPTDNCFIESFNRIFRDECLNENYFSSLSEAKQIIESWRIDYNENRPQKGLKELTPSQLKSKLKGMKNSP